MPLKIWIDAPIRSELGPEVTWTWRTILADLGYAWEELPTADGADIAYTADPRITSGRLTVLANLSRWRRREALALERVTIDAGLPQFNYGGEPTESPSLSARRDAVFCGRDLLFDIFWILSGSAESGLPRNRFGHFVLDGTAWTRDDVFRRAPASAIVAQLGRLLKTLCPETDPVARWPNGKDAALCFSHDVDYPELIRWLEPVRIVKRRGLHGLSTAVDCAIGRRTHWHFLSWVREESKRRCASAFYFVPRRGSLREYASGTPDPFYDIGSRKFRELFKALDDAGFEVGLQSSFRAFESEARFEQEKAHLEAMSGVALRGGRHHYWHLDPSEPETTLEIHERAGLRYDCSLSHERYLGWRRGFSSPYFPFHRARRRQIDLLQIPTVWMDDHLFGHHEHNPGDRHESLTALATLTLEQHGCFMVDAHEYVFDDALFPDWSRTYLRFMDSQLATGRFWCALPREIDTHCRTRVDALLARSRGLGATHASHRPAPVRLTCRSSS